MHPFYRDYIWIGGRPCGIEKISPNEAEKSFRIVADPHKKWISIEEYRYGHFFQIHYDSRFLDFRTLKPIEQMAWRKEVVDEETAWIFNEDDRALYKEKLEFEKGYTSLCSIYSLHGNLLCCLKMHYSECGNPFNGVVLFDPYHHPVMVRSYSRCEKGIFVDLEKEEWNMEKIPYSTFIKY